MFIPQALRVGRLRQPGEAVALRRRRGSLRGGGEAGGALGLGEGRRLGARTRRQQERHRIMLTGQWCRYISSLMHKD